MIRLPEILVLRHGETEWNRAGRMQGHFDSPLTETGREQARRAGAILRRAGATPATHRFLTSPQGRARATAALVLGDDGGAETDSRLREIGIGRFAGLTHAEIHATTPGLGRDAHFLELYAAAPGGEPFEALWARCRAFLAALDGPAVIVTHGITSRFLRTAATGRDLSKLAELPGGQDVVFRIRDGVHEVLSETG